MLEVEWKDAAIRKLRNGFTMASRSRQLTYRYIQKIYRQGRVAGTREMVVHENYLVVYTERAKAISILRVLHAAQSWPPD